MANIAPDDLSGLYYDGGGQVVVISFGYGHAPAPDADITIDTRRQLRDPHRNPAMRYATGLDAPIRDHVLATAGARRLIQHTGALVRDLLTDAANPAGRLVIVAVGCVGGRHRSVAIAEEIAVELRADSIAVEVEHRDVDKPVLRRGTNPS